MIMEIKSHPQAYYLYKPSIFILSCLFQKSITPTPSVGHRAQRCLCVLIFFVSLTQ